MRFNRKESAATLIESLRHARMREQYQSDERTN